MTTTYVIHLLTSADQVPLFNFGIPHRTSSPPDHSCSPSASAIIVAQVAVPYLPVIDCKNWSWPPEWIQCLNEDYVDGLCEIGSKLTAIPVRVQDCDVIEGSLVRTHLNTASKTLHFPSFFQYACDFNSRLDARCFILGMKLHWDDFYVLDRGVVHLITPGARVH